MKTREAKVGWLACAAFALAFAAMLSGGLLIAAVVSLAAILFLPLQPIAWRSVRWAWPFVPAALFLIWACTTYLWSPHEDAEQIPKTLFGIPLYAVFAWRVGALEGEWKRRAEGFLVFAMVGAGLFFLYETLTGGHGTMGFKLGYEGFTTDDLRDLTRKIMRSLGHGVAPFVLIGGPAVALMWQRGKRRLAIMVGGIMLIAAFSFDMSVNAMALVLASVVTSVAALRPRLALSVVFMGMAILLVMMPLLLPAAISALPDELVASLPESWAQRLQIWQFSSDVIAEQPWFGYGLDASRELGRDIMADGFRGSILPLHPHNAALHVWMETGLVGAILLAVTLVSTGEMLSRLDGLGRTQALTIIWVAVAYAALLVFSYGVWQEWHQASLGMAIAVIRFLDRRSLA